MRAKITRLLLLNRTLSQTVVKNIFWLGVSQIASRLIRVVLVLYAARVLGVAGYGVFSYALGIAGLIGMFSDFGINGLFIREVARTTSLRSKYISTTLSLKLGLLTMVALTILFAAPFITRIPEARGLLPLIALTILFDGLRDFIFSLIRALERMELEAGLSLFSNISFVLIAAGFLLHSPTPHNLALGYAWGSAISLVATIYILRNYLKELSLGYSPEWAKIIWDSTWPLAISSFFVAILLYTDTIMLGWLKAAPDLGFYAAAQKPIQFLGILPAILAASLLPAMSRLVSRPEKFKSVAERSIAIAIGIALPFTIGSLLLGNQLITIMYGSSYSQAGPVFEILAIALIGTFPFAIMQNIILAHNLQKKLLLPIIFGAIVNFALNLYFIPRLGALGAAIATVTSQLIAQGILYIWMQTNFHFQILFNIRKIIIATTAMGLAIIGLQSLGASFWLSFSTAIVVYAGILVLTKETLVEQLKSIIAEKGSEPLT